MSASARSVHRVIPSSSKWLPFTAAAFLAPRLGAPRSSASKEPSHPHRTPIHGRTIMDTVSKRGGTMFTTPSDREVVATHILESPRSLVFDAHTTPEHIQQWMLGPDGWTMPICEIDLRPGGGWRYVWRRSDGSKMGMRGEFRDVVPPTRVVRTESWGGDWPDTINTLVLTEDGGRTTITSRVLYPSTAAREAALRTEMKQGWSRSYERLDEYLSTLK